MPGGPTVAHGEVVRFRDVPTALRELDAIEDFLGYTHADSEYHRALVRCATAEGTRLAWTYVYAKPLPDAPAIESGDWRRR